MDGIYFVLAAFLAIIWCFERTFVKISPWRFRLNVLGAIHATTHELTALYNTTYITAETVVELLEWIAKEYPGLPIYIFLTMPVANISTWSKIQRKGWGFH